jgi:hypothetical protein
MRRLLARAFGLLLLSGFVTRAEAAPPESGLRVQVTNCAEDLATRLPSIVKLEIDVLLRERGPTRSPPEMIAVRCEENDAHIEVTLEGVSRASTIDLHALVAEHRARAVALVAAELVHSMAGRPSASEAPPNAVATLPRSRDAPEPAVPPATRPRQASTLTVLAGGLGEWRGNPAVLLFGGRLAVRYALGAVVIPELSADASFGGITSRSAHVAAQSLSMGAHLYFGTRTGRVRWEAGPGARFGGVFLSGEPRPASGLEGRTLAAAWGGPEVRARVAYAPSPLRPALLALQVGAGVVALPVRGLLDGTEPVYAVEGSWISICAELGFEL